MFLLLSVTIIGAFLIIITIKGVCLCRLTCNKMDVYEQTLRDTYTLVSQLICGTHICSAVFSYKGFQIHCKIWLAVSCLCIYHFPWFRNNSPWLFFSIPTCGNTSRPRRHHRLLGDCSDVWLSTADCRREPRFGDRRGMMAVPPADLGPKFSGPPSESGSPPVHCHLIVADVDGRQR